MTRKNQGFKGSSALPLILLKYRFGRGKLRLSRITLERGQKGKFLAGEKFALLLN